MASVGRPGAQQRFNQQQLLAVLRAQMIGMRRTIIDYQDHDVVTTQIIEEQINTIIAQQERISALEVLVADLRSQRIPE